MLERSGRQIERRFASDNLKLAAQGDHATQRFIVERFDGFRWQWLHVDCFPCLHDYTSAQRDSCGRVRIEEFSQILIFALVRPEKLTSAFMPTIEHVSQLGGREFSRLQFQTLDGTSQGKKPFVVLVE